MNKQDVIRQLYEIEAVKLGTFTLKSGATSPIYIDLRQIIGYPKLLAALSNLIWEKISHIQTDLLCGVPYTALPMATCLSLQFNIPMLIVRKEAKNYGTKKLVEGIYKAGQSCTIIEDIVTSGSSILTTVNELKAIGLNVSCAAAFIDREQGGKAALAEVGCQLFTVFTLNEFLAELKKCGIEVNANI